MLQIIGSALRIVGSFFGICERRQSDNNSPEMKKRVQAQSEVDADSKDAEALEKRDLKKIREEASE